MWYFTYRCVYSHLYVNSGHETEDTGNLVSGKLNSTLTHWNSMESWRRLFLSLYFELADHWVSSSDSTVTVEWHLSLRFWLLKHIWSVSLLPPLMSKNTHTWCLMASIIALIYCFATVTQNQAGMETCGLAFQGFYCSPL